MNSTTAAPARTSFMRVCKTDYVKKLVKEAKRVKYIVNNNGGFSYEVLDPDHDNSLVFSAVVIGRGIWAVKFSKVYWQEPAMPTV